MLHLLLVMFLGVMFLFLVLDGFVCGGADHDDRYSARNFFQEDRNVSVASATLSLCLWLDFRDVWVGMMYYWCGHTYTHF